VTEAAVAALGGALKNKGRLIEAIAAYSEAVRLAPKDADAHLDARARRGRHGGGDDDLPKARIELALDGDRIERDGMGERDELGGLFRPEDAGDPGDGERVPLGETARGERFERLPSEAHTPSRHRPAAGRGFLSDVDHAGATARVEMESSLARRDVASAGWALLRLPARTALQARSR